MTEVTAYHEAGHVLVALLLGARVKQVTIAPDDDDGPRRFGDTQIVWRRSRLTEQQLAENAVQVSLAGPAAEMIYTGDPFHPAWSQNGPLTGSWLGRPLPCCTQTSASDSTIWSKSPFGSITG